MTDRFNYAESGKVIRSGTIFQAHMQFGLQPFKKVSPEDYSVLIESQDGIDLLLDATSCEIVLDGTISILQGLIGESPLFTLPIRPAYSTIIRCETSGAALPDPKPSYDFKINTDGTVTYFSTAVLSAPRFIHLTGATYYIGKST